MILEGKQILVTGGTGSLGNALVRRLLTGEVGKPAKIIIFSRDEAKQYEMKVAWKHRKYATDDIFYYSFEELLDFRIGDIRDYPSVVNAVRGVEVVFHAAALKQVPTCEYFPFEAVKTNVIGTENLARAIRENDIPVELVVGVSTDKACKPINVMGMTKSLEERILMEANLKTDKTKFLCVRYGNVIASRGSVIPLFKEQIRKGGPVTITVKEMTRFLLSLDQGVDAIFAAVRTGKRGEIYVPRVSSVRIVDLVSVLIGDRNIPVEYIGIRPGEKIHEVLVSEEECFRTVERDGYYVVCPLLPELRSESIERPALTTEFSSRDHTLDKYAIKSMLQKVRYLD